MMKFIQYLPVIKTINIKVLVVVSSILGMTTFSCKDTVDSDITGLGKVKDTEWTLFVEVGAAPWNPIQRIIIESDRDSSQYLKYDRILKDTIIVDNPLKLLVRERILFYMSPSAKDSLLSLSYEALENFDFSENTVYLDGASIDIMLTMNGKSLECSYTKLDELENASPEVAALVKFINNKMQGKAILK